MDHHIRAEITSGLRVRGVDVLMAEEDGTERLRDPALLDRATSLGRCLVTNDEDLLMEAAERQHRGVRFAGIFYAHQLRVTIGQAVDELELACKIYELADMLNVVRYLPLQ